MMRAIIFRGDGTIRKWYVKLVGANNRTLNVTQGYVTHWGAKRAARKQFPNYVKIDANGNNFS